jgi:hypothetical protein
VKPNDPIRTAQKETELTSSISSTPFAPFASLGGLQLSSELLSQTPLWDLNHNLNNMAISKFDPSILLRHPLGFAPQNIH